MPAKTCVVIGDSNLSGVPNGTATQFALHLVAAERNVIFKNISSPGASLGSTDFTGFNSPEVVATLNRIGGSFLAFDCALIALGVNDFNRALNWGDTYNGLERIIKRLKAMGKKALVLDPIWCGYENTPNSAGFTLNQYRFFIAHLCVNVYPADTHFAHRENTVLGTSAGAAYFVEPAPNQLHLNAAGHRKLADWIKAEALAAGYF